MATFDITTYKTDDILRADQNLGDILDHKGNGRSSVAFVYRNEPEPGSKTGELLENLITKALNLKMEEVLLINLNKSKLRNISRISRIFSLNYIVLLDVSPADLQLNVDIHKNNVVNFGRTKFLFTDSLDIFNDNVERKKQFWQAMQLMFELKK